MYHGTVKPLPLRLGKAPPSPLQTVSENTPNIIIGNSNSITLLSGVVDSMI
jgi:hypothetical protein